MQHHTCWQHRGIETRYGGFSDNGRPRGIFVGRGYQLYLFYLPPIYQHTRKGRTMKTTAAPAKKPQSIKAYTIQRRGGGWVLLTLLAEDLDVVGESELDSRQACLTRLEDELRRLE